MNTRRKENRLTETMIVHRIYEQEHDNHWNDDSDDPGVSLVARGKSPWYWRAKIHPDTDPARHWPRFEKPKTRRRKQRARISELRRGDRTMRALAAIMEGCRAGQRCGSIACINCRARYRRWHISEGLRHVRGRRPQYHVTLTLERFLFQDISERWQIDAFRKVVRKRIERQLKGRGIFIGWIEVDYDADYGGFLPHLHGVASGYTRDQLHALKTKADLKAERRIKVPLKCVPIKPGEEMERLSYTCKQFPPRSRWKGTKHEKLDRLERTKRARGPSLAMKLLAVLGTQRLEDMAVMNGVKRSGRGTRLRRVRKGK